MQERLNRETLDPDSLSISQRNLEEVRELIPRVMEQLQHDKETLVRVGGHPQMQLIAAQTESYLSDLQQWASRAEDLLEQQASEEARYKLRTKIDEDDDDEEEEEEEAYLEEDEDCGIAASNGRVGGDTELFCESNKSNKNLQGEDVEMTDASEVASSHANVGVSDGGNTERQQPNQLVVYGIQRGRYTVSNGTTTQQREGLFDFQSRTFFIFERVIRDTIYGNVIRAQEGRHERNRNAVILGQDQFAIKVFQRQLVHSRRARGGQAVQENPLQELQYQQQLSNPGHDLVLRLVGCFRDEDYIYSVMPLAGIELFDVIASNGPFKEERAKMIFRDMLSAIDYVHNHGIAHRDISPENFLMDAQTGQHPILIDFGLAYQMRRREFHELNDNNDLDNPQGPWAPLPHTGFVGKVLYAAPELWGEEPYSHEVDTWSAAVTLFVMLFQAPPWERARPSRRRDGFTSIVTQQNLRLVLQTWNFSASQDLINLLQQVFREDPNQRLTLKQIREDPWLAQQ